MTQTLSRQAASDAISDLGWRFLLGAARSSVLVDSLTQAADLAAQVVGACGSDADGHLRVDLRADRVVLTLQSVEQAWLTGRDIDLARRISAAVQEAGLSTEPEIGTGAPRSVQIVELAIDAMDIAAIRPFWRAILGYTDEPQASGPEDAIVDAIGQGPAIWFQQMDQPRPQRNRIHFDICVPHDEAAQRIEGALTAGGRLVYEAEAPAFWVLADAEGNEACVTTWQGRD
jgi:4a-hydroxytetrahydrobiopterin dehydratase